MSQAGGRSRIASAVTAVAYDCAGIRPEVCVQLRRFERVSGHSRDPEST